MLNQVLAKVFGSKHERDVKRMEPLVAAVDALEPEIEKLSDSELQAKTVEFREQVAAGANVDDLVVPAFAVVREAARRTVRQRHYPVQLMGGLVLHQGKIAEMKTGEGKTLMSTLPAYLNALSGKGVHVVTVNDYLARRDADWMGQIYRFLGLTVGCVQHGLSDVERREAYAADVTYGTNNEFGFDYLRDNMKFDMGAMVQRGHHFAIVDEVDSILVDEARTPLIISGPSEDSVDKYYDVNRIVPKLQRGEEIEHEDGSKTTTGDFLVDEKAHTATLTDQGVAKVEKMLGIGNLYDIENMELNHGVNQALRAHNLFKRDVDYLIKDGQIVIVDEFTGRMMPGRRWSDGLHQAVEAKEGVKIERENQTLATITFQNYFRMYDKLSGMTGTADTEAAEFSQIYDLEVMVIPTNRPLIRIENPDVIYRTEPEKWRSVVAEIKEMQERGQPVLVGTVSIEKSETLSGLLRRGGVKHVVLNAKYHEMEAEIVAQAGRIGAVTIATNMAGRGTDILLGGNPDFLARQELIQAGRKPGETPEEEWRAEYAEAYRKARGRCKEEHDKVVGLGGLYILGTERHEARRIDNQLRGRAGRQGDPGASRFFLSLEDDLMRIFASERLKEWMKTLGMEEDVPIESPMVSRAVERAQKQVEQRNFEVRKHLLKYDDVNNKQRQEIYSLRRELLEGKSQSEYVLAKSREILDYLVEDHLAVHKEPADWDIEGFHKAVLHQFGTDPETEGIRVGAMALGEIGDAIWERLEGRYRAKEDKVGPELMREYERHILLQIIDASWKDHLLAMDHLKEGIGLRAYSQRDPLVEYKRESFDMFAQMKERIETDAVRFLFRLEPMTAEERAREEERRLREQEAIFASASRSAAGVTARGGVRTVVRQKGKVGRNAPCPCGSGKKYKKCCGAAGSRQAAS